MGEGTNVMLGREEFSRLLSDEQFYVMLRTNLLRHTLSNEWHEETSISWSSPPFRYIYKPCTKVRFPKFLIFFQQGVRMATGSPEKEIPHP